MKYKIFVKLFLIKSIINYDKITISLTNKVFSLLKELKNNFLNINFSKCLV